MPSRLSFRAVALLRQFESGHVLAEILRFPEVSAFEKSGPRALAAARRLAEMFLAAQHVREWHQRQVAGTVTPGEISLSLAPHPSVPGWTEPLQLTLPLVRWQHGSDAVCARIPALDIEVVGASDAHLDRILHAHARAALSRAKCLKSFRALTQLGRGARLEIHEIVLHTSAPTPAETLKQSDEPDAFSAESAKAILQGAATLLEPARLAPAHEVDPAVAALEETLIDGAVSALIVGPAGAGKTAALHEWVRRQAAHAAGQRPRVWSTSGARLVAGMTGFGMWQERCRKVITEIAAAKGILHLGNLFELMSVGRSVNESQSIASFFAPFLTRGTIRAVAECTPEQLAQIERDDPRLFGAFQLVTLDPPDDAATRRILGAIASEFAVHRHGARRRTERPRRGAHAPAVNSPAVLPPPAAITDDALDRLAALHRRYAAYSANPGRPARSLRHLLRDAPIERPVDRAAVTRAFSAETGLPPVLLDDEAPLDLEQLRANFSARILGQPEPVALICDLLATVKARLARPRKPIASLLFIGPTGVGKTEMAKALAAFLFGSVDRLARFDMSEFSDPAGALRLIGEAGPCGDEGRLTARVREQPFSVILLDEFEKAHPSVFDLMLQVLGEGRLTDGQGRLADFCNAVVIVTSNLGARSYRVDPPGFVASAPARHEAQAHFETEVRRALRPELFNRFDRIVAFGPLDAATARLVTERELSLALHRAGIADRAVTVHLAPELPAWLAHRGFDPRYGARPLRRTIERELLVPLADCLNRYDPTTPLAAWVAPRPSNDSLDVRVRARDASSASPPNGASQPDRALWRSANAPEAYDALTELRRNWQRLDRCGSCAELRSRVHQAEELERRALKFPALRFRQTIERPELRELQGLIRSIDQLGSNLASSESRALLELYSAGETTALQQVSLDTFKSDLTRLMLELAASSVPDRHRAALFLIAEESSWRDTIAEGLRRWAHRADPKARITAWRYRLAQADRPVPPGWAPAGTAFWRSEPEDATKALPSAPGTIAIALEARFRFAQAHWRVEAGVHAWEKVPKRRTHALVTALDVQDVAAFHPNPDLVARGAIDAMSPNRIYIEHRARIEDRSLKIEWSQGRFDAVEALLHFAPLRLRHWVDETLFGNNDAEDNAPEVDA